MAQPLRSLSVPQTRKWPTCHLQHLIKRKQSITFDNKGSHYTIQSQHVLKLKCLYILIDEDLHILLLSLKKTSNPGYFTHKDDMQCTHLSHLSL